jgi:benzylsuccinate CoA-transferase BbsF subunit
MPRTTPCPTASITCAGDDRWCAIAVVGDAAWHRFEPLPRLGYAGLGIARRAPRGATGYRWSCGAVDPIARCGTGRDDTAGAGVSACAVLGPDDLRADPHLLARNAIVTVEHPEIGPERHIANPLRMSAMPIRPAPAAPLLAPTRAPCWPASSA